MSGYNLLTEDEATTKICPLSFSAHEIRGNDGSGIREGGPWNCQASACMAWRKVDQIGIGPNGEKRDRDLDGRTRWVDRGFCGAFGRPLTCPAK